MISYFVTIISQGGRHGERHITYVRHHDQMRLGMFFVRNCQACCASVVLQNLKFRHTNILGIIITDLLIVVHFGCHCGLTLLVLSYFFVFASRAPLTRMIARIRQAFLPLGLSASSRSRRFFGFSPFLAFAFKQQSLPLQSSLIFLTTCTGLTGVPDFSFRNPRSTFNRGAPSSLRGRLRGRLRTAGWLLRVMVFFANSMLRGKKKKTGITKMAISLRRSLRSLSRYRTHLDVSQAGLLHWHFIAGLFSFPVVDQGMSQG